MLNLDLKSLWNYRELLYFLVWRDFKVRYKQTVLGASWAVAQPFLTMLVFTGVFSGIAQIPSEGLPYEVFVLTGLLPWNFVAHAVTRSGTSIVGEGHLVTKIYFPRLLLPIAATITPAVDLLIAFGTLILLMGWFHIIPSSRILLLPVVICVGLVSALAVTLWLCALHVRYRDVGHIVPLGIQLWMFASPVLYPMSAVPPGWQHVFAMNPSVGLIETFRWCLVPDYHLNIHAVIPSLAVITILFTAGLLFFKHTERTFSDNI